MAKKKTIDIENLISSGLIGAALGALISKSKGAGALIGGLAGAAIAASLDAYEKAKDTNLPLILEENHVLYEVKSDGSKKKIKNLPQADTKIPKRFELK